MNEIITLKGKPVFICEEHHHVLTFWHQFRNQVPYLLTFDHHTDLHRAFQHLLNEKNRNYDKTQKEWDLDQSEVLKGISINDFDTILRLKHDEHIDAAIQAGIIKKALVYSYDSYRSKPNRVYAINGDEKYNNEPIINNSIIYQDVESPIESTELEEGFKRFDLCLSRDEWMKSYILDIDLDFFHTCKSIHPIDVSIFKKLIDGAIGISIAKESLWIKQWKEDYDKDLSVEYLLNALLKIIEK